MADRLPAFKFRSALRYERSAAMTNRFTLDDIVAEMEKRYAPMTLDVKGEEFVLVSLLRVNRKVRDAVQNKLKEMGGDPDENGEVKVDSASLDEDKMVESLQFILSSVTKDNKGARLVHLLPNDMTVLMEVLRTWQESTQPGEA